MIPSYFQLLLDAAQLSGSGKIYDALLKLQSAYQQKLYFVAFIGQYSAGKSCLLNQLLQRDLLPEGVLETTPLLTYIRYGQREEARLHYLDGAVQVLEPEEAAQLVQREDGARWNLEQLDYMEIFVREDMLRSGMVLLDTPGANTLIKRHEQLLEASLSAASCVVYVTSRAPTRVDVEKMNLLASAGLELFFVRTHCDEINLSEESLEQVKAADQKILSGCGLRPEQCYYVSSRSSSRFYEALPSLKLMLAEKGAQAGQELEQSVLRQLQAQAPQLRAALQARRDLLQQVQLQGTQALEERQAKTLKKIRRLESQLKAAEDAMHQSIQQCRQELQGEVAAQLETAIRQSASRIANCTRVTGETEMAALLQDEAGAFSRKAYGLIYAQLDSLVKVTGDVLSADEITLEPLDMPQAASYQDLCADQDQAFTQLRTQLQALSARQADLTALLAEQEGSAAYTDLEAEVRKLDAALSEIQRQYDGLPPYTPQMLQVEDGKIQPSQIARTLGMAADWALLLIPGAQIEGMLKGLANTAKVSGKLGRFVGVLENAGKILKAGDPLKDTLFALQNIGKRTHSSPRRQQIAQKAVGQLAAGIGAGVDMLRSAQKQAEPATILDMLTIEYWAGKLGEHFDRPPKFVVDEEYQAQYQQTKAAILEEKRQAQERLYEKKRALGLLQSEEDRLRAEAQRLQIDQAEVERELERQKPRLAANAQKKWREDCARWYQQEVSGQMQQILEHCLQQFPARIEAYMQQRIQALQDALAQEQASYDELKHTPPDETALELQRLEHLLEEMSRVFP